MNGHGRSTGGFGIDRDSSVMLIVETALEHGVEDPRQIAYMLATAQHETRDFSAPEEDFGRSQARKLGYSGGEEFYGRGYVHLTHDYNYRKFDELLDLGGELVESPEQAKDPELAARILVIGMRDGLFTGRRLDRYINDGTQDAYNARRVVNGITRQAWTIKAAEDCERYAKTWEQSVPALIEKARSRTKEEQQGWQHDLQQVLDRISPRDPPQAFALRDGLPGYLRVRPEPATPAPLPHVLRPGDRGEHVRELQLALDRFGIRDGQGRPLVADGQFGARTRQAVENFQLWNGFETSGVADREMLQLFRDPSHSAHPEHATYLRIRSGIRTIDEGNGKAYDEGSERISRCLLALCRGADGVVLRRVDHVVSGTSGNLFAIEGRLDDPAQRRVVVRAAEAASIPVEESDRRLAATHARTAPEPDIDQARDVMLRPQPAGRSVSGMPGVS